MTFKNKGAITLKNSVTTPFFNIYFLMHCYLFTTPFTFATTFSTVNPNCSNNIFAGALAPNVDIVNVSPSSPTYLPQP